MTLKEANMSLEQLENEYNYWLREKEIALSKVMPKAIEIKPEVVEGGKRVDRMLEYSITMDDKKIDETLEYIQMKKDNIISWMKEELRILEKYGEVESLIIQYKECKTITDEYTKKNRPMTWDEIASKVHYSKSFCRNIYRNYKKMRNID